MGRIAFGATTAPQGKPAEFEGSEAQTDEYLLGGETADLANLPSPIAFIHSESISNLGANLLRPFPCAVRRSQPMRTTSVTSRR